MNSQMSTITEPSTTPATGTLTITEHEAARRSSERTRPGCNQSCLCTASGCSQAVGIAGATFFEQAGTEQGWCRAVRDNERMIQMGGDRILRSALFRNQARRPCPKPVAPRDGRTALPPLRPPPPLRLGHPLLGPGRPLLHAPFVAQDNLPRLFRVVHAQPHRLRHQALTCRPHRTSATALLPLGASDQAFVTSAGT